MKEDGKRNDASGDGLPGFEKVKGRRADAPPSGTDPKPRLIPVNRRQMRMMPVDVERLIPEEHEARAIWEFVGRLDLALYYREIASLEGEGGRPAYDPQVLMSLWIYGYSKGIGSARELARRTEYDPAFQWIAALEIINYHTLSDFRISHKEALDRIFVEVLGIMSAEGLITLERITQDGTKIKACAGTGSFRREATIAAHLEAAKEQVRLLQDSEEESLHEAKARIRTVQERKERLDRAFSELKKVQAKAGERGRASITDPDARIMKQSDGGYAPSYNLQISADAAHDIIVAHAISQHPEDFKELLPAVERIEDATGKKPLQMIADGGYTTRENIIGMAERDVDFIGSFEGRTPSHPGQFASRGVDDAFRPDRFLYDPKANTYTCPEGKVLYHKKEQRRAGETRSFYYARARDCETCVSRPKCCGKRRSIVRSAHHPAVGAFIAKMEIEEAKDIYKTRAPIAEFPHAWIKEKIGLRQFRLRGLLKVGMEALWACVTYNIQQWIRLCWRPRLVPG